MWHNIHTLDVLIQGQRHSTMEMLDEFKETELVPVLLNPSKEERNFFKIIMRS